MTIPFRKPYRLRTSSGPLLLLAASLVACGGGDSGTGPADDAALREHAEQLAQEDLLIDTHIDVPYRLVEEGDQDISVRTASGHFDYPRARQGGLDAPFMSIYVPAALQGTGGAKAHADMLIDMVDGFVDRWPDKFALASSTADIERNFGQGVMSLPMGMENGAPIETIADLQHFYDRGIRYITLTHSENNQICDSSYAAEHTWNGLSPFGVEVVHEMNRLGIMVDISHVSDDTFRQVLEISEAPVIASHSSCRYFTPGFERNPSDELIQLLATNGGVLQINFGSAFVDEAANRVSVATWKAWGDYVKENGLSDDSAEAKAKREELQAQNPTPPVPLSRVADHIEHVIALVGVDHVGIGSDFDGVTSLPEGLGDVSMYPALIEELLRRGLSDQDIEKILGGNLMRVWRAVEAHAAAAQAG